MKKLTTVFWFIKNTCINFSYMIKYMRWNFKNMLKENIKNYDLEELKTKLEEMRRKKIQSRANFSVDI